MSSICHINHPRTQEHSYENAEILKLTTLSPATIIHVFSSVKWLVNLFLGGDRNIFTHAKYCHSVTREVPWLADLKITIKSV